MDAGAAQKDRFADSDQLQRPPYPSAPSVKLVGNRSIQFVLIEIRVGIDYIQSVSPGGYIPSDGRGESRGLFMWATQAEKCATSLRTLMVSTSITPSTSWRSPTSSG